ncbi:MAG TPA: condensation domain-containing protein, partial [Candidatus Wallbacteria bacterium]|nr:condensation domain-containing protein [Candidatus Wallbacteria bacterium]
MKTFYNLSNAQKRIYFDQILNPGSCFANICYTVKFKNNYDAAVIKKALNCFIKMHDSLRFKISRQEDPLQYAEEFYGHDFEAVEFFSETDPDYIKWVEENNKKVFEIYDSELFDIVILKFKTGFSGIYARFHHLIHDGFSAIIFLDKIEKLCSEISSGKEPNVTKTYSYADYLNAENEYTCSENFIKHREYWLEKLSPPPEGNIFTASGKKSAGYKTNEKRFNLSASLTSEIDHYCSANHITRFILFMSAVSVYFSKVSANNDTVIGFPYVSRRGRARRLCAMLVSTTLFRSIVDENINFSDYSKKVSDELNHILSGPGDYPFNILAQDLKNRKQEFKNLLDINLVEIPELKNQAAWCFFYPPPESPSPLTININPNRAVDSGGLEIIINYWPAIASEEEIELLYRRLEHILKQAVSNPETAVKNINILPDSERRKLLEEFNATREN